MKKKVLCVGLAVVNIPVRPVSPNVGNVETTLVDSIGLTTGGDACNQSIILSRLGNSVVLASRFGNDWYGEYMTDKLKDEGIDVSIIAYDEQYGTSSCIVLIQEDGRRTFCVYKGALRNFSFADIPASAVQDAGVVSIGGLFALPAFDKEGAQQLFKLAKESGVITVADTKNDVFHIGLEGIRGMLPLTDYFMPSYEEATYLSGKKEPEQIAEMFLNEGARNVLIKLGDRGCFGMNRHERFFVPAFNGPVVDTTGAGDNFMAGFIHGLLLGWSFMDCALFGNAAGMVCVSQIGATTALKNAEQIETVLYNSENGRSFLNRRKTRGMK